jgi:predicted dehydrogenase
MRLGIVGAGEVAWRHAAAAAGVDGLTLVGVHDRDVGRAGALARAYGSKVFGGLPELFGAVEIVVLAVPHAFHAPLALEAAAAGCRVLVEKPLGMSAVECDQMISAVATSLYVGQQGRFFAQVNAARGALAGLGRPLLYRERRSTSYADSPDWVRDASLAGGGIAMLVGVHSIDRACWLLGKAVRAVAGTVSVPRGWSVETGVSATLFFDGGMRAQIALVDSAEFFHETVIVCARGTLRITPSGLTVRGRRVVSVDADREYTASFRRQYEALLGGMPVATAAEGRQAVAVVEALYRSARSGGGVVRLD